MDLSLIIPSLNEEESLPELCAWIERVMIQHRFSYEIIIIDDGSTDNSWSVIESLHARNPVIRGIRFQRNYGKSAALNEGFAAAMGAVVITMDADMQDSPDEIPALREMIVAQGFDLVSGWKQTRHDPIGKTIPSKFFNWVTARVTRIPLHDFNCGLKAYNKKVVKNIEIYGDMHRYIPVIAKWAGYKKIGEKIVQHYARRYGVSKFGWGRIIGLLDLLSIMFVSKYGKKPMQFFGLIGTICFFIGFSISFYLIVSKLINPALGLSNRPPFYMALTAMVIGTQLFVAGFLGELVSRSASKRNSYLIDEKVGLQ